MRLDQFLKWKGLASSGGEAKFRIQRGDVLVNGCVETRRGRQLLVGDSVHLDGSETTVAEPPGQGAGTINP
jgi:ribosome-associated protein